MICLKGCVLGTRLSLDEGLKVEAWPILWAKGVKNPLGQAQKVRGHQDVWARGGLGRAAIGWDRRASRKCELPSLRLQQDPII